MARMLTSEEAANRLGVKVTTLYVYVSRGLLASHPEPGSRRSLFAVEDVERLADRSRSGRPTESRLAVVTTSITLLDGRGPVYRGVPATELCTTVAFEDAAALLWRAEDPSDEPWTARRRRVPQQLRTRDRLPWATVMAGADDAFRADLRPVAVVRAARQLVAALVASLEVPDGARPRTTPVLELDDGRRVDGSIAGRVATACGATSGPAVRAINAAMVLLADHELATSTLAVRVAASTRADVYDAVLSGLGTSAGTLHSAASDMVLELLGAAGTDGVEVAMGDAVRRHGYVPGFGHSAYPDGDPRATALLALVAPLDTPRGRSRDGAARDGAARSLADRSLAAAAAQGFPGPNIDFALAALAHRCAVPAGLMPALFQIARVAGWVAHYLEELDEAPLRFRARAIHTTDG